MSRLPALLREALASARSQPVASLLTIAMVAGMCVTVLLTTGRTVAAEQAVLAQIDAAGTRTIVVRASDSAGMTVALLDRLRAVAEIESVTGLGPIVDARNATIPGGTRVAIRNGYGSIGGQPLLVDPSPHTDTVLASSAATRTLGLCDGTGGLLTDHGQHLVVAGRLQVPPHLAFLEPLVLVPSSTTDTPAGDSPDDPLAVVVVLADQPSHVAAVEDTVRGLIDPIDPTAVTIETSTELAAIRAAVSGELGSYGRSAILGILAVSAVLVAVNLLALVMMRRKDFGRRRALGATQSLIISLLLAQVVLLAAAGAALGTTASLVGLAATGNPLPGAEFAGAVAVSGILIAALAALAPAVVAARRDPLHELRVP